MTTEPEIRVMDRSQTAKDRQQPPEAEKADLPLKTSEGTWPS